VKKPCALHPCSTTPGFEKKNSLFTPLIIPVARAVVARVLLAPHSADGTPSLLLEGEAHLGPRTHHFRPLPNKLQHPQDPYDLKVSHSPDRPLHLSQRQADFFPSKETTSKNLRIGVFLWSYIRAVAPFSPEPPYDMPPTDFICFELRYVHQWCVSLFSTQRLQTCLLPHLFQA